MGRLTARLGLVTASAVLPWSLEDSLQPVTVVRQEDKFASMSLNESDD